MVSSRTPQPLNQYGRYFGRKLDEVQENMRKTESTAAYISAVLVFSIQKTFALHIHLGCYTLLQFYADFRSDFNWLLGHCCSTNIAQEAFQSCKFC